VKLLLAAGVDISAQDRFGLAPLHYAVGLNHFNVIESLNKEGAKLNKERAKEIDEARSNQIDATKLLINNGAAVSGPDLHGQTPLHWAVRNNRFDLIKLLIDKSANVNAPDPEGYTPLHFAASNNDFDAVELLIDKGAVVNAANKEGFTPLHYATSDNDIDVV